VTLDIPHFGGYLSCLRVYTSRSIWALNLKCIASTAPKIDVEATPISGSFYIPRLIKLNTVK